MKVAFVFIVKDGEEYLQTNLDAIKKFNQDIYAVENNSVDNTKNILSHANLKKVISLDLDAKNSLELCNFTEHVNCAKRVRRLAYIRQRGLDAVISSGIAYDYICMLDMDFIKFDEEGLDDMFMYMEKHVDVDAIFGMSHNQYGIPYDIGAIAPNDTIIPIMLKTKRYVEVDSAFSGFGIYRYSSIRRVGAKYNYTRINDIEHKYFNSHFDKVLVDTEFNPIYSPWICPLYMTIGLLIIIAFLLLRYRIVRV